MKKYIAAAALASIIFAAGCSQSPIAERESLPQSEAVSETADGESADTAASAESASSEEVSAESETAAEFEPLPVSTIPINPHGYSIDWLYGKWSAVAYEDNDFWDYATFEGHEEQPQLTFYDGGVCRPTGGEEIGIIEDYFYQANENGVDLYSVYGDKLMTLTRDLTDDTLSLCFDGNDDSVLTFKHGDYLKTDERFKALQPDEWVYGLWSIETASNMDYWEYAFLQDRAGQTLLYFDRQGYCHLTVDDPDVKSLVYRFELSDEYTVEISEINGEHASTMVYDPSSDTLSEGEEAHTVYRRGEYPEPQLPDDYTEDWILGTWSVTMAQGMDYWDYAYYNFYDEPIKFTFTDDMVCKATVLDLTFTYKVRGFYAVLYEESGGLTVFVKYHEDKETMELKDDSTTFNLKLGDNPKPADWIGDRELKLGADWLYDKWTIAFSNGNPCVSQDDLDGNGTLISFVFYEDRAEMVINDGSNKFRFRYQLTDNVVVLSNGGEDSIVMTYFADNDAMRFTLGDDVYVVVRSEKLYSDGTE